MAQINISVQNRHILVNVGEMLITGTSPIEIGRQLTEELILSPAIAIEVGIALERSRSAIRDHEFIETTHIQY